MLAQPTSSHLLTLRAQLTKSSSLVITYSPLLLATDAGLAAATAVLFSLTGTTLQQKVGGDLYHLQSVYWVSVLHSDIYTRVFLVNSPRAGILAFCTAVQTLLLNNKYWNGPVGRRTGQKKVEYNLSNNKNCLQEKVNWKSKNWMNQEIMGKVDVWIF